MATDTIEPRRSTRVASLARFRYRENDEDEDSDGATDRKSTKGATPESDSALSELSFGSDIEDAVEPRRKPSRRAPKTVTAKIIIGKRKRTSTVTTSTLAIHGGKRRTALADTTLNGHAAVKKEVEEEERGVVEEPKDKEKEDKTQPAKTAAQRRVRKPARVVTAKVKREGGGDEDAETAHVEPPSDWEEMYELVKTMRLPGGPASEAAVDTMGCERLAQADASPRDRRFHTLVALMLSSQTKDTVNAVAMARLQAELPPHRPGAPAGLNLDNMLAVDPALLNKLIWQVGFHNNKTRYLKQAAEICRDQWGGDIPPTAEALMALPGVGPKMAYLCLAAEHGWNRVEGIGVDVHVHRLTNLWGWQHPPTKTPEATRLALQSWLPHDRWKEINWLLVGFGQTVCPSPQGARCGECTLGLRGLCRAADRRKVAEGRRRQQQEGDAKLELDES